MNGHAVHLVLLAVDGAGTSQVVGQLTGLQPDHTHLFVSTGGNDALGSQRLLSGSPLTLELEVLPGLPAGIVGVWDLDGSGNQEDSILDRITDIRSSFRKSYHVVQESLMATGLPVTVCTIYDQVPGLEVGVPVIDLRSLCDEPADYSEVSEIEPSGRASVKMSQAIRHVLKHHDFSTRLCAVYGKQVLR